MRALVLALAAFSAQAEPYSGLAADSVTTAIGLSNGAVETNPLGWAALPLRIVAIEHAKTLPPEQGVPRLQALNATSWAATANNLLVLAGAGPAAPIVGLAVGLALWQAGEHERHFWQACAVHKADNPNIVCTYRPAAADDASTAGQPLVKELSQ